MRSVGRGVGGAAGGGGLGGRTAVRATIVGFVTSALLGSALLWQDRTTLQHGNHLYRSGDTVQAIEVYRDRALAGNPREIAAYNLGTALVTLDPTEAGTHLRGVITGGDSAVVRRGLYNLGYGLIASVREQLPADSAITLLAEAVRSNRLALRLDVSDEDARWNLALSQRLLDSLANTGRYSEEQGGAGTDDTRIESVAITRSPLGEGVSGLEPEGARATENIGQRTGSTTGARESWASQDPGPVSDTEALRLVDTIYDGPELLVRGILWSNRPDVAWWASQPYPGGNW